MKKTFLTFISTVFLTILSHAIVFNNCSCTSYTWTPYGWGTNYASNTNSCSPNGMWDYSNFYSFGTAEYYFEGQYLGSQYYTLGNNYDIRNDINCFNYV